eukprot:CAMPEP_0172608796 /NCGR_PEP_ID=MMETSP1068-20121228/28859_1 /TAXON_ID=35684 /ORGANISM="Pseudopedinella elastica, Strain CCMP716" /LENGTH=66 /DNA_ID=CAMNT_0013412155 /DNA_START=118 /DNA_END=315 /DNA_ORIENTATION=+
MELTRGALKAQHAPSASRTQHRGRTWCEAKASDNPGQVPLSTPRLLVFALRARLEYLDLFRLETGA